MDRLTITLTDDRHQALKQAAVRRGRTIGELIEASLDAYGIKSTAAAADLVARARERSQMSESEALELANAETHEARRR